MFGWLPFGKKEIKKDEETEEQKKERRRKKREAALAANAARTAALSGDAAAKKKHAEQEASVARGEGATGAMLEKIMNEEVRDADAIESALARDFTRGAENRSEALLKASGPEKDFGIIAGGRKRRKRTRRKKKSKRSRTRKKHGKGKDLLYAYANMRRKLEPGEHHVLLQNFEKMFENKDRVLNDEEQINLEKLKNYYTDRGMKFKKSNRFSKRWQENLKEKYNMVTKLDREFKDRRKDKAWKENTQSLIESGKDPDELEKEDARVRAESSERLRKNGEILNKVWRTLIDGLVEIIGINVNPREELMKDCDGNRPWLCLWRNVNKMNVKPDIKEKLRTFFKNTLVGHADENVKEIWCTIWGDWKNSSSGQNDKLGGCHAVSVEGGRRRRRKRTRGRKKSKRRRRKRKRTKKKSRRRRRK